MRALLLLALAGAALIAPAMTAAPAATQAAQRDWAKTVAATPAGGFRIGNPDAPVKLVEYGSLTCDHCADFHADAMAALKRDHIASGRVSYEFRNFVLNGPDLAASLIARCQGAPGFFGHADWFFGQQQQWLKPFGAIPQAERQRLSQLPQDEMMLGFVSAAGLEARMAERGMTPAQVKQCLSDKAQTEQLVTMRKEAAAQHGIDSTPTFLINGTRATAHDWATLEPLLRPPGS